jgi:copper transport protein
MRLTLAVLALLGGLLVAPSQALSHAVLIETSPRDGDHLEAPPAEIVLRFNEPVALIVVRLLDARGTAIPLPQPPTVRDTSLRLPMPAALSRGNYVVTYRVTSADSHPVGGAFPFSVGQPDEGVSAARPARSDAALWQVLAVCLRVLFYIGVLTAAGGALFHLLVDDVPMHLRRRLGVVAVGAVLVGLAGIGVQGGLLLNPPVSSLLDPETWRIGATSTRGTSMILSIPGLLLLLLALSSGIGGRVALIFGIALALGGFLVTGHAATANPIWLTAPAMALHALAVSFWVGSLAPLAAVLRASTPHSAALVVHRFSRFAVFAVASLLGAGLALAVVQVVEWSALPSTEYGLILSTKLVVVGGLLALALYNKWRLTPALDRSEFGATTRLRRAIYLEMVVIAAIFIATATLGAVPPPRTMITHDHRQSHGFANAHDEDAKEAVTPGGYKAVIHVETRRTGSRHLQVTLTQPDGRKLEPLEVTAHIFNDRAGVAAITRKLSSTAPGEFALSDAPFPFAGIWTVEIEALVTDFEKVSWSADITVKSAAAQIDPQSSAAGASAPFGQASELIDGKVTEVDASAQEVTITHGPLRKFNMEGMTMVFRAADPSMLKAVKAGDRVKFIPERINGQFTVTKIEKVR